MAQCTTDLKVFYDDEEEYKRKTNLYGFFSSYNIILKYQWPYRFPLFDDKKHNFPFLITYILREWNTAEAQQKHNNRYAVLVLEIFVLAINQTTGCLARFSC